MPNKTIYLREADVPLFEQAQALLGESLSSLFARFLRDRIEELTPDDRKVIELRRLIARDREDAKKTEDLTKPIAGDFSEADRHAKIALERLRAGNGQGAIASFTWARQHHLWANRELEELRDLVRKIARE